MKIKSLSVKTLAGFLTLILAVSPAMTGIAWAQAAPQAQAASDDEIQAVQQLAQAGYLGDKKDYYLSSQSLTEDDITDALLKAKDYVMAADLKNLQSNSVFQVSDLQSLLDMVKDKAADIRARKASAWKLENRLEKMIALLSATPAPSAPLAVSTVPAVPATPMAIPATGPSQQEFSDLKDSFKTLNDKLSSLQGDVDKKSDAIQALQKSDTDIQSANEDIQEQLKLVKKLLDQVQGDLGKSENRMDDMQKQIDEKMATDTDMEQEITVMHKDLRDDTEDISILKEEVAKLDKTDTGPQSPLDDFLGSKWLPGGALVVGLTALVISLTRH